MKIVVDTNILISAAIYPDSVSANALALAARHCDLYRSEETTLEIAQVLMRPKFDRYFAQGGAQREEFLEAYQAVAQLASITNISTDCSDPKDNKFLSLCLSVSADVLVSGDRKHLVSMHPYCGIAILSEADFVRLVQANILLN